MENTNSGVKKAKEVLKQISEDERERRLAELRQKYILDQKAIEDAGYDKGIQDGLEKGIKNVAKSLKEQGISIDKIAKATGLTKEQIQKL